MLLTEYLPDHNLYLAIPIVDGHPGKTECVFTTQEQLALFVTMYFRNPVAALFAYYQHEENQAKIEQAATEFLGV